MEVVGIALAIPPLLAQCGKLVKRCYDAQLRLRNAPHSLASIITECNAISFNLSEVQFLGVQELGYLSSEHKLNFQAQLNRLAFGCIGVLCKVEKCLESFYHSIDNEGIIIGPLRRFRRKDQMRFAWNEDEIGELLERLRGYEISLTLSLSLLKVYVCIFSSIIFQLSSRLTDIIQPVG